MRAHCPSSHQNNNAGYQVPSRPSTSRPTQPDAQKASTPPYDAHARVLQVVVHPRASPSVLGKGVNTTPGGYYNRIEKLLASACASQPKLPDQKHHRHNDPVADERRAHDEMC